MAKADSATLDDAARWNTLLDRLSVADLTEDFQSRVQELPHYRDAPLTSAEIRRTGEQSFEALINSLRAATDETALPDPAELRATKLAIATDVGVSRARAGIPVESLMTAIRVDFSVIWGALTALSAPDDALMLVDRADSLWQAVDSYASQTQGAYIAERQRMATEASSVKQGLVASLFGDSPAPAAMVERAATALDLDPNARLSVVVAAGEDAAALRVGVAMAARRGAEIFTHPFADALAAFWPTDDRPGSALHEAGARIAAERCGMVEEVPGLAELREAGGLAWELALLASDDDAGALRLDTAWARLASARLAVDGIRIAADVETVLAACGPVERERLVETMRAYVETGSVAGAARQLFCHRNTMMNRLHRFRDLTGVDLTVPAQSARLVVAWA